MSLETNQVMRHRIHAGSRRGGFSMLELLVVMFIIALGYAMLLPVLDRGYRRGKMIKCTSNLRQIGIAFTMFAHDHNDFYPMQVPVNGGGSMEFDRPPANGAEFWEAFRHFQVLSNELLETRVLTCRLDPRLPATNFATLRNVNLSFFIATEASYLHPLSILAGDRNLLTSGSHSDTMARIEAEDRVFWTGDLHGFRGNLLLADGSVHDVGNAGLRSYFSQSSTGAVILLPPANITEPRW